jgi:outer membrane protein
MYALPFETMDIAPARPRLMSARALAFVLLFALVLPARAQQQAARTITFDEAVQIALERNIDLKKAKNDVDLQSLTVTSERADFLPNLNMSVGPSYNFGLTFDQTAFRQVNQSSQSANFRVNSSMPIFNGFSNVATLNRAKANLEANDYMYDRQRQTVLFNVITNFLSVIVNKQQVARKTCCRPCRQRRSGFFRVHFAVFGNPTRERGTALA